MTAFSSSPACSLLLALWAVLTNNSFIRARNKVDESWSGIDVQLKRRHDLVPNLVDTVKGYAAHESATLAAVTQARSAAMSAGSGTERSAAEGRLTGRARRHPRRRRAVPGAARVRELPDADGRAVRARGPDPGRAPDLQRQRQHLQHGHPAVPELARGRAVVHATRAVPARLAGRARPSRPSPSRRGPRPTRTPGARSTSARRCVAPDVITALVLGALARAAAGRGLRRPGRGDRPRPSPPSR